MVSTCTHGLQPCSRHPPYGEKGNTIPEKDRDGCVMGSCPAELYYHRPMGMRHLEVFSLDNLSGGKTIDANFLVVWCRIIRTTLRQREWSETRLFIYHYASMARKSNRVPECIGLASDQNFLALSLLHPSPPFFALLRTHGTVVVVASGRADFHQLRIVFASWDAWHCHFINYL